MVVQQQAIMLKQRVAFLGISETNFQRELLQFSLTMETLREQVELWETAWLTWSQAEMCFLAAAMAQGKPSGMVMDPWRVNLALFFSFFELIHTLVHSSLYI